MSGEKKIVGLWRESAANPDANSEAAAEAAVPETVVESPSPKPEAEETVERDWLDTSALYDSDDEEDAVAGPAWRERVAPTLLVLLAIGWTSFAVFVATDRFVRTPALADWPGLLATIAMPLTLLAVLWMALLRSSRSEQARFARVAAALRAENAALSQSMLTLGQRLADAQAQLSQQARTVEQLGAETVGRLTESGDKLAANASVIANAYEQLSGAGDQATQRMDGLLAGLPKIDYVVQRLATNFREAGLAAHQQGASLEAQIAALAEQATSTVMASEASATTLHEATGALKLAANEARSSLMAASAEVAEVQNATLATLTKTTNSARDEMTATIATLTGQMDDSWQKFREGVDAAATQLDTRLAEAREAGDAIGTQLTAHGEASEALASRITAHATDIGQQLETLDASVLASTGVIGRAIDDTKVQLSAFTEQVTGGNGSAEQLIAHAESLLLALDAVTRELEETLPLALDRMASHSKTTTATLAQVKPMLEASELVAQSTLSHVNAARATLQASEEQMDSHAGKQEALAGRLNASLAEADAALARLRSGADEFTEQGGAQMIATLGEVRTTAEAAANEARETLDQLILGAREAMQATASEAIDAAFKTEVAAQLTAIEEASQRAVDAANSASNRLMGQINAIMETSASVEQRTREAEQAISAADRESLARQVGLLTEALKSTAIDVTKILSSEVSDTAWDAYLKGDRSVFARRAVKLIENGEAKEILRLYQADDGFHAAVNQFIHDFEAMLRLLIGARDGSAISVTLLSSDIGKLYVALAQAIDRLRG